MSPVSSAKGSLGSEQTKMADSPGETDIASIDRSKTNFRTGKKLSKQEVVEEVGELFKINPFHLLFLRHIILNSLFV